MQVPSTKNRTLPEQRDAAPDGHPSNWRVEIDTLRSRHIGKKARLRHPPLTSGANISVPIFALASQADYH